MSLQAAATPDPLSATFSALADPTRRAILARLASGETSVTKLAEPFEMSMPAISKHLKVLERAGLIARGREAQWRPCRLEAAPLKDVSDWVGNYRHFWEESFDRLDAYLVELKNAEKQTKQPRRRRNMPASTAKASSALIVTTPSDREIMMTRVFDAPRRLVFEALSKPEHLLRWFGPHSCPIVSCEMDFRPGGAWRFILRGPDGKSLGMRGVYREIARHERLVSTESFDDYPGEIAQHHDVLRARRQNNAHHQRPVPIQGNSRRRDSIWNGARGRRNL